MLVRFYRHFVQVCMSYVRVLNLGSTRLSVALGSPLGSQKTKSRRDLENLSKVPLLIVEGVVQVEPPL